MNNRFPMDHLPVVSFKYIPGVTTAILAMPYEEEVDGNVTYTRYTDGYRCKDLRGNKEKVKEVIFRKTVDGSITRNEKTIAFWEDRKTATYIPINSTEDKGFDLFG